MPHTEFPIDGNTYAHETIAVDDSVKAFTVSKYRNLAQSRDRANAVIVTIDGEVGTDGARWTTDGTAPASGTTGHLLPAGECLIIRGTVNIARFKVTREGSNSVVLSATFLE